LGVLDLGAGRYDDARAAFEEAIPLYKNLTAALPESLALTQEHAKCLHNLALANRFLHDPPAAGRAARAAVDLLEPALRMHPDLVLLRAELALAYDNLGVALAQSGQKEEGLSALRSALTLAEAASRQDRATYERLVQGIRFNWDRLGRHAKTTE
jgi:tetratricopeptide (TPR) repeat protein